MTSYLTNTHKVKSQHLILQSVENHEAQIPKQVFADAATKEDQWSNCVVTVDFFLAASSSCGNNKIYLGSESSETKNI